MKETKFIEQNKKKWSTFESSVRTKSANPEELSEQFNEITDDLSYARTFYKRRSVRVYLNQVSQGVYNSLYKQKKEGFSKIFSFWKTSLPLDIYYSRKNILLALVMFVLWTAVGAVSQAFDADFVRTILGDGYVDQTIENIEAGNPLGVYGSQSQTSMFLGITMNNIRVSFFAFIAGVFWTLGTHILLMSNGIMLGAFQYFFKTKGLLLTSILGVWIHGAFEISAIVIAGGAGITLGNAILFPGSYTRMQSFMIGARRGIKILMSLVPVFFIAGFLESYVTRNYLGLEVWSKTLIILISFACIIFYYVIYPFIVARKNPERVDLDQHLQVQEERTFTKYKLRKLQEIFNDGFVHYRQNFNRISRPLFGFLLPVIVLTVLTIIRFQPEQFDFRMEWFENLYVLFGFGPDETNFLIMAVWAVILAVLITTSTFTFHGNKEDRFRWKKYFRYLGKRVFLVLPYAVIGLVMIGLFCKAQFEETFFEFFFPISIPFVLLAPIILLYPVSVGLKEGKGLFSALGEGLKMGLKSWWKSIGVLMMMSGILMFFWFIIANPLASAMEIPDVLDLFSELFENVLIPLTDNYVIVISGFKSVIYLAFFVLLVPLVFNVFAFHLYSIKEERESLGLHQELKHFGKRKRTVESDIDFE